MSDICVLKMDETAVLTGAMRRSLVLVMDKDVAGHHIGKVCIFCHVFAFKIGRCALNFTRNVGAGDFSRLDREYVVYWIAIILQGFDRSLLPRIRKAQAGSKKGTGKDAVSIYENCIMCYYFFGHQ